MNEIANFRDLLARALRRLAELMDCDDPEIRVLAARQLGMCSNRWLRGVGPMRERAKADHV
jgi:hypothetical protein